MSCAIFAWGRRNAYSSARIFLFPDREKARRNVVNSRDDVISRRESAADNLTSFNSDVRQREFN